MKKLLPAVLMATLLISNGVFAGPRDECSYSPLQQVIRRARSADDIANLIVDNINLNINPRCGGNVLQLATLRGNLDVFTALVNSGQLSLDDKVSNRDYPIPGAPKEIPLGFFIAYYAPSLSIMQTFINSGANLLVTDDKGETILWYLNQNPVLMDTEVTDYMMRQLLLSNTANENQTNDEQNRKKMEKERKKNDKSQKEGEQARSAKSSGIEEIGLIEAEPDNPYKRQASDGFEDF